MFEGIEKILSSLGTLLRFVASGFVFLVFIKIFKVDCFNNYDKVELFIGAIVSGLLIYAVHVNFFHRLICLRLIYHCYTKCGEKIKKVTKKKGTKNFRNQMYHLDLERWKRRVPKKKDQKDQICVSFVIQKQMDTWSALINFLYCSSGAALITCVIAFLDKNIYAGSLLAIFGFLLICSMTADYRNFSYEMKLSNEQA